MQFGQRKLALGISQLSHVIMKSVGTMPILGHGLHAPRNAPTVVILGRV